MGRPTVTPSLSMDQTSDLLYPPSPNPSSLLDLITTIPSTSMDHVISHASSFSVCAYTSYVHRCYFVPLPFYVDLVESQVPIDWVAFLSLIGYAYHMYSICIAKSFALVSYR